MVSIFVERLLSQLFLAAGLGLLAATVAEGSSRRAYAVALAGFASLAVTFLISSALVPDPQLVLPLSPFVGEAISLSGLLFLGAAWPLCRDLPRQRVMYLVLAVLLGYWMLADRVHLAVEGERLAAELGEFKDGVCLQPDSYTCAPSSGATLLRLWGQEDARMGEVAFYSSTAFTGTELTHLARGLRGAGARSGLEAVNVRTSARELEAIGVPAVIGIEYHTPDGTAINHAVCLLRLGPDEVIMGDPLQGPRRFRREGFFEKQKWDGNATFVAKEFLEEPAQGASDPAVGRARASLARAVAASAAPAGGPAAAALAGRAAAIERSGSTGGSEASSLDARLGARLRAFRTSVGLDEPGDGRLDWRTRLAIAGRDPREYSRGRTLRGRWSPPPGTEGDPAVRQRIGAPDLRVPFEVASAVRLADRLECALVAAFGILAFVAGWLCRRGPPALQSRAEEAETRPSESAA